MLKDGSRGYALSDAKMKVCRYDDGSNTSALTGEPGFQAVHVCLHLMFDMFDGPCQL